MADDDVSTGPWTKVALVLSGLAFAILCAEVVVRLYVPVRDIGSLFTVNDPIMGKRIKKNLHTVRMAPEFTMTFTSNSLGFRGPEFKSLPVNSLLFIGDSFTMGFGVSDGEEFPALVGAKLDATLGKDAIPVVNTGMGNNGNGRWIKLLRTEVDQFKPQLVVLQVMANDFDDNLREGMFELSERGDLIELPVKISRAKSLEPYIDAVPGLSSSYLFSLLRQVAGSMLSKRATDTVAAASDAPAGSTPAGNVGYAERLTERLLAEAVAICKEKGYPVLAVLVGLEGLRLDRVRAIFQAQAVPIYVAPLQSERPDLYYKIDGHWNARGHAHVADAVLEKLESSRLIRKEPAN